MKVKELEGIVKQIGVSLNQHLLESGEIRTDLAWLKKAFWVLAAGGVTFNVGLVMALLGRLWK